MNSFTFFHEISPNSRNFIAICIVNACSKVACMKTIKKVAVPKIFSELCVHFSERQPVRGRQSRALFRAFVRFTEKNFIAARWTSPFRTCCAFHPHYSGIFEHIRVSILPHPREPATTYANESPPRSPLRGFLL
jgi:hypothetical protein